MTLWNQAPPLAQWAVVIGASLVGAVFDVKSRRIPNALTGPLLVGGLLWAGMVGGAAGLADAAAGCVVLAAPYILLFLLAEGGAGDAKLMGAIGAWLGLVNGLVALGTVAVCGVVLAVGFALAKRQSRRVFVNVARVACWAIFWVFARGKAPRLPKAKDMPKMPYGVAIFMGVCLAAGAVLAWRMQ
ncbi:MAG: prepilin peptidase [Phycisphaerae bacterium]|nr:prepilin peptidase [Phycisphaerae bacterium]